MLTNHKIIFEIFNAIKWVCYFKTYLSNRQIYHKAHKRTSVSTHNKWDNHGDRKSIAVYPMVGRWWIVEKKILLTTDNW